MFNFLQFAFQNFVTEYFKSKWLVTEEKNATVMQVQLWHDETFMRWRNSWNSIEEYKLHLNKQIFNFTILNSELLAKCVNLFYMHFSDGNIQFLPVLKFRFKIELINFQRRF